jgi:hypothetical protein
VIQMDKDIGSSQSQWVFVSAYSFDRLVGLDG